MNDIRSQMELLTGLPQPRIPLQPAQVQLGGGTMVNNLSLSNCNVGVVNTGHIQAIARAVGYLATSGSQQIADAFAQLTKAVVESAEATSAQKAELLEYLDLLAIEASNAPEKRKSKAAELVINKVATILSGLNDLSSLWARLSPHFVAVFG